MQAAIEMSGHDRFADLADGRPSYRPIAQAESNRRRAAANANSKPQTAAPTRYGA